MGMEIQFKACSSSSHPSLRQGGAELVSGQSYRVHLTNHSAIQLAYGPEIARFALRVLGRRLQGRLGVKSIAELNVRTGFDVTPLASVAQSRDGTALHVSQWVKDVVRNITLEPVLTSEGVVHLQADVADDGRSGGCLEGGAISTDGHICDAASGEAGLPSYRSEMAVLSPVLAAIWRRRVGELSKLAEGGVEVGVGWRPVCSAAAQDEVAFYEASLALIGCDGRPSSSDQVVASAERIGLIHLLDQFVVLEAVKELVEARGAISLMVAVSAGSFVDRTFWLGVLDSLKCGGVSHNLIVEIRGSEIHGPIPGTNEMLAMLRGQGCRISIGRLGVGLTSLRDLAAFDPSYVTIDKLFLSPAIRGHCSQTPLTHLVALARSFGADVIVDGVESADLSALARKVGATLCKGLWCGGQRFSRSWARVVPPDALREPSCHNWPICESPKI